MILTEKRWIIAEQDEALVAALARESGIPSLIVRLLLNRGLTDTAAMKAFLNPATETYLDPYLFQDMEKAVSLVRESIARREKILIYGDYDADGVTSTALLLKVLQELGSDCSFYIPNRFTEGYGINNEAIEKAAAEDIKLIISVDTGIAAVDAAELARELGIKLIVTDHHEPPEVLPCAEAIINPKRLDDTYPFDGLAGVGVAFKLAHALLGRLPSEYLDLVAIGTIADLAPLVEENRLIAIAGLELLSQTSNLGLRTLLEQTNLTKQAITSYHIGYIIGPRINAVGRLESSDSAVRLLLTEDYAEAKRIVAELETINRERQLLVKQITDQALAKIEAEGLDEYNTLVVADPTWNAGVIGIVASHVIRKYYKPTIILNIDEETGIAKGSARSIAGFNLFQALTEVSEHLLAFGGHPAAAGMSVEIDKIDDLRIALSQVADEWLIAEDFVPCERVDAVVDLDAVDYDLLKEIETLEPYGIGNPKPLFLIEDATVISAQRIGKDQNHLRMALKNTGKPLTALYFHQGELGDMLAKGDQVSVIGELTLNEWRGYVNPQLIVTDLRRKH